MLKRLLQSNNAAGGAIVAILGIALLFLAGWIPGLPKAVTNAAVIGGCILLIIGVGAMMFPEE